MVQIRRYIIITPCFIGGMSEYDSHIGGGGGQTLRHK